LEIATNVSQIISLTNNLAYVNSALFQTAPLVKATA